MSFSSRQCFSKQWRTAALAAAATAALVSIAPRTARAGLAINWLGDDYTGNGTWNSNTTTGSQAISASSLGSNTPSAVANAFGTHTGVDFSAGAAYFEVPAGTFPINATPANFTVAVAFKANGTAATTGGNFFQGQNVFGNDSPGGGTPDWCFTWGGQNNQSLFGSIGFQGTTTGGGGGDSAFQTGSIDLNAVHAAVMVVDSTNNQQRYYLDGRLIGQRTGIVINPRSDPNLYRIGGGYFNGSFNGRIAELRVYDDTAQNGLLLSSQLANAYGGTYGVQQLFTWTDTAGAFNTGTNWDQGTAPNDVLYHQTLVNNGGTAQISGTGSFNVSDLWVGSGSSGVGHVTQTGGTLNVGQSMILGQGGGTGDFDMSGGTLNVRTLTVAGNGGTLNTATMTVRGNSVVNVVGGVAVSVGNVGNGNFNLQDTAQLNTGTSELWVGNGSTFSTATMGMSGGTLNVNNWLAIGRDRSTGVLNLSGGVINKTGNGNITIGAVNNSTFTSNGTVNQTGGQLIGNRDAANVNAPGLVNGEIYVGETTQGKGTWNFSGGSASAPVVSVGYSGQGSLNISGTAQLNTDWFGVARAGTFGGTANLNGGSVTTGQVFRGGSTGPGVVNFNGTTITPTADNDRFVAGFGASELVLQNGGAVINTNGHSVGVDSGFSGTGPLIKNGAGVLTLNAAAANTHSGNTIVNAGTLKLEHVVANNSIFAKNVSAYYRFNDASNLGKDSSPNANDVTDVVGTATISTATAPPNHTSSLSLPDNSNNRDFLSTVDGNLPAGFPTGNSSYTLAAWINVDGTNTTNSNGIIGWGDVGVTPNLQRSSITFRTQANGTTPNGLRNSWFVVDNAANLGTGTSLLNQWHHVVATYDANTDTRRIFVDGSLLVSDFQAGLNNAGTANFRIGMATLQEPFSGNMADLLVTRSALTPAQIQQLYTSGLNFGSFSGATGALSPNSVVQIAAGATLDLNGASTPSGGLADVGPAGGSVTSSTAGSAVLTVGPAGSISFGGVIQNGAGTVGVGKSGAGTQVLRGANTYTGTTTVQAGTLVLAGGAKSPVLGGPGGGDIKGGRLALDYNDTGTTLAPTVKSILTTGFGQTPKFSSGALRTSNTPDSNKGLGWVDNTTAKQVLVGYVYYGDANLDGTVDTLDFNSLAANFGGTGKVWSQADFNYDGTVDTLDFNNLAANFGRSNPDDSGGGSAAGALVPEPTSLSLLGLTAGGLLAVRRRRRRTA